MLQPTKKQKTNSPISPAQKPFNLRRIIKKQLASSPCLSLTSREYLKEQFLSPDSHLSNLKGLDAFEKAFFTLRKQDSLAIFKWLKNHSDYDPHTPWSPKKLRISVTPAIGSKKNTADFYSPFAFSHINRLHEAFAIQDGIKPIFPFIGEKIAGDWCSEYRKGYEKSAAIAKGDHKKRHKLGLKAIKTMEFSCQYFTLRAFKSAPDQLTFTPKGKVIMALSMFQLSL